LVNELYLFPAGLPSYASMKWIIPSEI